MANSKMITGYILALALSAANAASNGAAMRMVDSVASEALAARGWNIIRAPAAEESITLQIGLTMQNQDALIAKLQDVSDPKSPNYAKWLDRDEVNQIAAPSLAAADAVTKWLKGNDVSAISTSQDGYWINFRTTVSKANDLLGADFQQYHNDGVSKIRTASYSVPADVMEHIDLIHPTTFFGKTQAFAPVHIDLDGETQEAVEFSKRQVAVPPPNPALLKGQKAVDSSCRLGIGPSCLKQLYNVGDYKPDAASGSNIGFGSFLNETASHADLALYLQKNGIADRKLTKVNINNANDDQSQLAEHGEANLDAQNMFGVADPLPVTEFLTGGQPPFVADLDLPNESQNTNEPYVPYYTFLLSKTNAELPQAISNSYGEPEHTVPKNYAARTCTMIAMMGLRGISVFESSGDTGIGSGCLSNDGQKRPEFNPQFPGTCPWITAIGGTENIMPEIAWKDSSGGFSYYFERPWYQVDAVSKYLSSSLSPETAAYYKPFFNDKGRAFPDVSAHSLSPNYQVYVGSRQRGSGGTSAASPVWASLVGMLNDARLRAKKPTMGFLNPWLYAQGNDFLIDITQGKTRGCSGINFQTGTRFPNGGMIKYASWNATEGWDPATGLGIPDFQKMLKSAMGAVGA